MSGVRLGGPVRLDPTAFVAPGAMIAGDVRVGRHASVWFNTVIRGDSAEVEIGEASNVQDNSVVHEDEGLPARIGARVTVGHRAIVHGCVIEDDCLIGMGAVLLSGARIGAGSLVGAGALVREGQQIPPGSLAIGMPARVVGEVGEAHRAAIRNGSEHYAELSRLSMRRGLARPVGRSGMVSGTHVPMTTREWRELCRELAAVPAWIGERAGRAKEPAFWRDGARALEALCRMRDRDRELRRPCLEALLAGREPLMESGGDRALAGGQDQPPGAVLAEWEALRAELVNSLQGSGPDSWDLLAGHPTRGPFSLAELLRDWVEEDHENSHRIAEALAADP